MAAAQINLGVALRRAGRWSEALTAFRDGERLAAETGGYVLAITSANAGDCLRELGRPARALEAYDRSLQTPDPAADEPMALAMALGGKGRALLELDRFEEAVEVLERGLEVGGSDAELAMIRFALGQAIWRAGGDRRRAHDLVGQAREHHVGLGAAAEVVEDIDAWLRDHPL